FEFVPDSFPEALFVHTRRCLATHLAPNIPPDRSVRNDSTACSPRVLP
ncbi:MAG: hypothetical protein ACI8TL_000785, partial [Natronomonas sp.]